MERDIFEDVRKIVGCIYISDLPYRKRDVLAAMRKINFSDYTQEKMIELLEYVFQEKFIINPRLYGKADISQKDKNVFRAL